MTNSEKQEKILKERHIQDRHRAEKKKRNILKKMKPIREEGKKKEDVRIERRKGQR